MEVIPVETVTEALWHLCQGTTGELCDSVNESYAHGYQQVAAYHSSRKTKAEWLQERYSEMLVARTVDVIEEIVRTTKEAESNTR